MVLVIPGERAVLHVESQDRGGVEVVPRTDVSGPGAPVPGAPIGDAGGRIVAPGEPDGHAACLPGVPAPGLAAGLAGRRDRVRLPGRRAGRGVERGHEAADAELATGHSHHHLALGDQGREGHVVARAVVLDFHFPHDLPRPGVERHQKAVRRRHEHEVAVQPDAPVGGMHLREIFRQVPPVAPEEVSGRGVQGQHVVEGRGDEHHPVVDHGRRLVAFPQSGGEGPEGLEPVDVVRVDLVQWAVAVRVVGAPVHEPVARFRLGQPGVGDR